MSPFAYDYRDSLDPMRSGLTYSIDKMKTNAHAAPYAAIFVELRDEHAVVHAVEVKLKDQRSEAQARVDAAGEGLAEFANRLCKQVLVLTDDNRQHPQYKVFFDEKTPGQVKRLLLAGGWEMALEKTEHDALKPFGVELKPLLAAAGEALKARSDADHAMKLFREAGERKQLFDKVNAARKLVYGELSKLPFEHLGLAKNFADKFFTKRRARRRPEAEPTPAVLVKEIEALKAEVAAKEQLLSELEEAEAKAEQKEAAAKAEQAAIEALEKQAADALAQAAAKKAKLAASQSA